MWGIFCSFLRTEIGPPFLRPPGGEFPENAGVITNGVQPN
jgi:hypothetical protein